MQLKNKKGAIIQLTKCESTSGPLHQSIIDF